MMKQTMKIEYALLGILWKESLYGYDIYRKLQDSLEFGFAWRIKKSKLYALLGKLEQNNWLMRDVELETVESTRKYYRLTETGRSVFLRWAKSTVDVPRDFRLVFLTKLYFLVEIDLEAADFLIQEQLNVCRVWLENIRIENHMESKFLKYYLYFKEYHIQSLIGWLEACLDFNKITGVIK